MSEGSPQSNEYPALRSAMAQLLQEHPSAVKVLKYLACRKRISRTTDVSQLVTYLSKSQESSAPRSAVVALFVVYAQNGIGRLERVNGREKFHWKQWVFPLFHPENRDQLIGLELKSIEGLLEGPFRLEHIAQQLRTYERAIADGNYAGLRPDVILESKEGVETGAPLEKVSLEALLQEIRRRGWSINLSDK